MRRRDFLRAGALAAPGLTGAFGSARETVHAPVSCIFLMLVGGPSQLDTWDPKPDAPSDYRGPFRPVKTNVPGIEISEIFPRMARHAEKYALIRSVHHEGPSYHDAGHQLMQTGRYAESEKAEHPCFGSVFSSFTGVRPVVLPFSIGATGGNMSHGQGAAYLGEQAEPAVLPFQQFDFSGESEASRRSYGLNRFGQSCLMARRLVESGRRFVTVNMFETVFGETTWDIHGAAPFSPISCYRNHVGPMFDQAYVALLEDLQRRGMLESTLVVAMGEFGRSPKINPTGGRDHWPQCSTVVMAGGGIEGGQVYGTSDRLGAEPKDNPVGPQQLAATIYSALGVPLDTVMNGVPVVDPGTLPITALLRSGV